VLRAKSKRSPEPLSWVGDEAIVVVVAIEDSASTERATTYAAGLARRIGATLVVSHVQPQPCWTWTACASLALTAVPAIDRPSDPDLPARLLEGAANEGLRVRTVALESSSGAEVAALADSLRADAVVLGARRSRLRLPGSLAGRLQRHARWPVIVVP